MTSPSSAYVTAAMANAIRSGTPIVGIVPMSCAANEVVPAYDHPAASLQSIQNANVLAAAGRTEPTRIAGRKLQIHYACQSVVVWVEANARELSVVAVAVGLEYGYGLSVDVSAAAAVHGNSLASGRLTTLYRLNDQAGNLLKWGITSAKNPLSRYSRGFLSDKRLIRLAQGSRAEMAAMERTLTERVGGPMNLEPWAGTQYGNNMELVDAILEAAGQ
jgi:hypothetical protein